MANRYLSFHRILATPLMSIALTLTALFSSAACAQVVLHTVNTQNIKAEAEFHQGDADKPAVLILHGFLTTNQFHTVKSMASALQEGGYTTLSPTLSLNINLRKQSVKCNAIHTHTLEEDIAEIHAWINWLKARGHHKIVLLGHSSGSQELLAYLEQHQPPEIQLAIFTSLFYLNGTELGTLPEELDYAANALKANQHAPRKYTFLFCKKDYYATPASFLSYQKLDRAYILKQLSNLSIPSYTLMGGADKRYQDVGLNWLDELGKTPTHLTVVKGANHFFSSEYEFDLQEQLLKILDGAFK